MNVLWCTETAARQAAKERGQFDPCIELVVETDPERYIELLQDVTLLVTEHPDAQLLDAPNLRHLVMPVTGLPEHVRQMLLQRPHLRAYNTHGHAPFVAQQAVALLLACACRLLETDRMLRLGDWSGQSDPAYYSLPLKGKNCLFLGYGMIARNIQQLLAGFEMHVRVIRRNPPEDQDFQFALPQLSESLGWADVIFVTLPETPETLQLLQAAEFDLMKPSCILVNVGRGATIDQSALYTALQSGRIFAAGLDVWWNYPRATDERSSTFPADLPFHELPNVIMQPHRSGSVAGWEENCFDDVLKTVNAVATGGTRNEVDPVRGY